MGDGSPLHNQVLAKILDGRIANLDKEIEEEKLLTPNIQ
jgi:hypothetical protein